MTKVNKTSVALALLASAGLTSCGGGGGSGPAAPISVAFSPALPASLSVTDSAMLTAVVSNDSTNSGVNWAVSCASSDCGAFNPAATASGAATTYTPPATVPSVATVTITATSVADGSKAASGAVGITAAAGPVLADGTYIVHVQGFDATGPYFLAAAFSVAAGKISGGDQDYTDVAAGGNAALVAANCSLSMAGNNIQVVLATASASETLRGAVVSPARVLVTEFDASATATGSIDLQTSTAAPAGSYAFGVQGTDTSNGLALVIGGVLDFNGTALDTAGSVFDLNDGGNTLQKQSFASGSVTAPDAYGRVIIDLVPAAPSTVPEFKFAAYVVGTDRMSFIEDQSDALNANLGGTALGQGGHAGSFTLANVSGVSYAHGSAGADTNGAAALAGGFALNADGTVGGRLTLVDPAHHNGNDITGSYTVDPTGRVTLNQISLATNQITLYFQLYLDGNGNGIVMGIDSFQVTQGLAYQQTATQGLGGPYALSAQGISSAGSFSAAGPVTVTAGAFSGSTDYNNAGSPQSAVVLAGTQDTTNGTFQLTGLDASGPSVSDGWGYYPIDNARTLAIEVDGQQLGLLWLEGVTN